MKNLKKIIILIALSTLIMQSAFAEYEWARVPVNYCFNRKIMSGNERGELMLGDTITRAQMAKMLVSAFSLKNDTPKVFTDNNEESWAYEYINDFSGIYLLENAEFYPSEPVTREEFTSYLMIAAGLGASDTTMSRVLETRFSDCDDINTIYKPYILTAVKSNFMQGNNMKLNPKGLLTRAEACALFYRVLTDENSATILNKKPKLYISPHVEPANNEEKNKTSNDDTAANNQTYNDAHNSQTPLLGEPTVTLAQAKQWAAKRNAHQRFIDIADYYWYYGSITGIRPEVLYAQAAKETNFGKYTGRVVPEQNNWAGIKTKSATGDTTYDHESFATPEDGVRAHFNHMCAYIGLEPVGTPHDRYFSVKSLSWAGTVKTVEELGGKWAPYPDYGISIMEDYVYDMQNTSY